MKAIGYVRISIADQSRYSMEGQERAISEYCQRHKLELINVFKDDGESSYTFDRPDFQALEKFIRKSKDVQYLIIYGHDRFSRNLAEALMKIKELHDKFGIKVLATTDSIDTDFSDPMSFMMRAFQFMMAEGELHRIRKRTRDGYISASLKGLYVNKAPYGYVNAKDGNGNPTLKIDEEKAAVVRLIFDEYRRGSTIEQIRATLKPYDFKLTGRSAIQRILGHPAYAGLVRVPSKPGGTEQVVKGIHEALVPEPLYWAVQDILNGGKRFSIHSNEDLPLKGVLRCHCGRMMSSSNPRSKSGKHIWYYICSLHRKNLNANKLHEQMNEILDTFSFAPEQLQSFEDRFGREIQRYIYNRAHLVAGTEKALRKVREKIADVEERYLLQEGRVNRKTYDKVIASLRAQEGELLKRLNELSEGAEVYWQRLHAVLPKLHDMRGTYLSMDFYRRQQFLNLVFESNLTHDGTTFRTPKLHDLFVHNALTLKEKGLLVTEQPLEDLGETPGRTAYGTVLELGALNLLTEILS